MASALDQIAIDRLRAVLPAVQQAVTKAALTGGSALASAGQFVSAQAQTATGSAPIVFRQSMTTQQLIDQAMADGWQVVKARTLIPDVGAALAGGHLVIDAIEWRDVAFLGFGNADLAASQFQTYIEQAGSHLYAWAVMQHDDFNLLGFSVRSYRLLLLHSQIQIGAGAIIAIVVAAFAALVIYQYYTQGSSPALDELTKIWHDLVSATVNPVAEAAISWWVVGALAAAGIALASGAAAKRLDVKAPPVPKPPSVGIAAEARSKAGKIGVSI